MSGGALGEAAPRSAPPEAEPAGRFAERLLSGLRRWTDPTGLRAAILISVSAALANGVWMLLDHTTPSWDQSHYLSITWQYRQALDQGGLLSLLRSIHSADPSHGPLFTVLMLPFSYVFGNGPQAGLILNFVAAPVLFLAAGEIAAHLFGSWRARLLTIVLVALVPLVVGLYHEILQDFLLVTLVTVSVLLLLKTELFQRRGMSFVLGLAMALGALTKVTFPGFIIGPFLVVAARAFLAARRSQSPREGLPALTTRTVGLNLLAAVGVLLVPALLWFITNFSATLDYVRSTTNGALAAGAGPQHPFTLHAIASFTANVMNDGVSWILALSGIAAALLCAPRVVSTLRQRRPTGEEGWTAAFLLAWVIVPYLSLAFSHNQDVRLLAPALPGVAVIVAGLLLAVPWPRVRTALITLSVLALGYQILARTVSVDPSFLPAEASVRVGSQVASIPLDSQPIGYLDLPQSADYGTPVIRYVERIAEREPGAGTVPVGTVCMLESHAVVNGNTFTYLSEIRGDFFSFPDVVVQSARPRAVSKALRPCTFALYIPQPRVKAAAGDRLAIVNRDYAAHFMTPALLRKFRGPSRTFPVGPGPRVHVLVRRPTRT